MTEPSIADRDCWLWMDGELAPITEPLQSAYFEQGRGQRDALPDWHTPVQ